MGNDKAEIRRLRHQFEPYRQELFGAGDKTFSDGYYDGTFFRFPLRTDNSTSKISKIQYDMRKVEDLIRSLDVDASSILLFLAKLQSIAVYKKMDGYVTRLLDVRIAESCLAAVREQREIFRTKIAEQMTRTNRESVSSVYPLSIEVVRHREDGSSKVDVYHWITSHYYSGSEDKYHVRFESNLGYLPSAGAALPIYPESDDRQPLWASEPKGRLFCFFPLPLETKSPTGLRVHVHGYFAVDQNRRNVKWPTADQDPHKITDLSLVWNQFLIEVVIPKAMTNMVKWLLNPSASTNIQKQSGGAVDVIEEICRHGEYMAQLIYAVLPGMELLTENWRVLIKVFKKIVKQCPMFYSPIDGGRWLLSTDVVFDGIENLEATYRVIRSVLCESKRNICCVPTYVMKLLPKKKKLIDVNMVCNSLRKVQNHMKLSSSERTALLNYAVENLKKDGKLQQLVGLKLLPLADDTWTIIGTSTSNAPVYVGTQEHPQQLLPGLGMMFLHEVIAPVACKEMINSSK